jgi:hypothetical protein
MKTLLALGLLVTLVACAKDVKPVISPEAIHRIEDKLATIDNTRLNEVAKVIEDNQRRLIAALDVLKKLAKEHEQCIINANTRIKAILKNDQLPDPVKVEPAHHGK